MSRRLVLCLDGTWNTYKDHTNVSRLHALTPNLPRGADGTEEQIKFYDEGVGTGSADRIRGGALGMGLSKNICQAYAWLVRNYLKDSELFIFGFSRGAYTARSLAGLIARCGIAQLSSGINPDSVAERAYKIYRGSATDNPGAQSFRAHESREVQIHFLGVWDTVGALGVPSLKYAEKFHNTELCANVSNAYHAVAIDEHRAAYDVLLWTANPGNAQMEQRWFPGAHANVGGGYEDDLLPDLSLAWMLKKAYDCGLYLGQRKNVPITPDDALLLDSSEYRSPVRDSYREFALGAYAALPWVRRHFRPIGNTIYESVDPSVFKKLEYDPNYRPTNLAHAGSGVMVPGAGEAPMAAAPVGL